MVADTPLLCCSWLEFESAPVCPIAVAMAIGLATGGGGGGGSIVEGINPAILDELPDKSSPDLRACKQIGKEIKYHI